MKPHLKLRFLIFPLAVLALTGLSTLVIAGTPVPRAANVTFTVNSTADSVDVSPGDGACLDANGLCTLRAAIMEANALGGAGTTIKFDPSTDGTPIKLTLHGAGEDAAATGDLDINQYLTITGNGTAKTIIDGDAADRVFDINPAAVIVQIIVEIDDLTVQNGSGVDLGGGLRVHKSSTLGLNSDLIQNNTALSTSSDASGGGIFVANGNLSLVNTTVKNNTVSAPAAGANGGGIAAITSSVLTITAGSVIAGNTANAGPNHDATGGGIYAFTGSLSISKSAVRGNKAIDVSTAGGSAYGGGIGLVGFGTGGSYSIVDSEISGNIAHSSAVSVGGGIDTEYAGANSALINTTIAGNSVIADAANGSAIGGGASFDSTPFGVVETLDNVTLSNNSVNAFSGGGGGLDVYNNQGTVSLHNSIIAGNQDSSATAPDCSGGTITSGGYNLIGNVAGCNFLNVTGDQVGTASAPIDPLLGPLADNGGNTMTMALLPGSPAVDAGNPAGCPDTAGNPLTTDQRGYKRPTDGNADGTAVCDIGAYERAADNPPTASNGALSTNENTAANGTLKASDPDHDPLTFAIATPPTHGTVKITDVAKGTFSYTPAKSYSGSDLFTFTANDGFVNSNTATVSLTVKAAPPSGGGGGSLSPLGLLALALLGCGAIFRKRREF